MANPTEPRRRFAPVPIETTFEQYRKTGPAPELTPSPSPRSESPPTPLPAKEKRRFAPQLVESSVRRSRRVGDDGPATRHTDRTDITPYTNHIYAPRSKRRHARSSTREQCQALTRRESCDDEIAGDLFDLVAKDAQRKLQEAALSAFPNSNIRIGGAEHFYVREGSDDDNTSLVRGRQSTRGTGRVRLSRRNSSTEDISWAFKEMQEHAAIVESRRERISTPDLDRMSIDGPPSDAMGLTTAQRQSLSGSPLWTSSRPPSSRGSIGDHHLPHLRPESPLPTIGESTMPYLPPESPPIRPIGETLMPYIPSAPAGKAADMAYAPPSKIPAETGFASSTNSRPSPSPFAGLRNDRDMSLERLRNLHRLRTTASPPMLGGDLTFRMCPSPKQTKLEPDHLWDLPTGAATDEPNRDATGQHGLWRGYCYTTNKSEKLAPVERPAMISTPFPATTPGDPFARAFSMSPTTAPIYEEPALEDTQSLPAVGLHPLSASVPPQPEHRTHPHEPKSLHMLQSLDERLRQEKEAAELEDQIMEEFDDTFVTQVYNYLSLGYPATARIYDEELCKISRINLDELEQDDDIVMDSFCDKTANSVGGPNGKKSSAPGYIILEDSEKNDIGCDKQTPRWRALKEYIYEWARQHPDLNSISPLAWGMQERRGSWGL